MLTVSLSLIESKNSNLFLVHDLIDTKLKNINYDIFRIKISSGDIISNLKGFL
jgi:hypothetical protein